MEGFYGSSILTEEFDMMMEYNLFLEAFDEEMSPEEVQERLESIANNCQILSEEYGIDILNEGVNPKQALSKFLGTIGGSTATLFNAITGCAKGVAKEIKTNGIGKKSIAGIQDQFNKMGEQCSKAIYTEKFDNWLKEFCDKHNFYDVSKVRKAVGATIKCWVINNLMLRLLGLLIGPLANAAVIWIIGPLVEENAKQKAIKGGYEKEFLAVFNAIEASSYIFRLTKDGVSFKGALILRLKTAVFHVTTTIIQKIMQSKPVMKFLKLDPDKEEDRKNAAFIGKIAGFVVHSGWNILDSSDGKLAEKIKGKELSAYSRRKKDETAQQYGYDSYQHMKDSIKAMKAAKKAK